MGRSTAFNRSWTGLLVVLAAAQAVHPDDEADTFWHLSLGRVILAERSRVFPEPLALPAFTSPAVEPQWLWDSATYLLFLAGSWQALAAFSALLAGIVAFLCTRLVGCVNPSLRKGSFALVTSLAVASAIARLRLRPEAAGLVFLLTFLLLSFRIAQSSPRRSLAPSIALLAVVVLCAQMHGTFVLAPAVYLCVLGPIVVQELRGHAPHGRHRLLSGAVTFVLLCVALASSAYGLDIAHYISAHSGSDSVQYVQEMRSTTWSAFDPSRFISNPFGVLLAGLWSIGVVGMLVSRKLFASSAALALFGSLVAFDAIRFLAVGAVLSVPLAAEGASVISAALPRHRLWPWTGAVVGSLCVAIGIRVIHLEHGPIGSIGPAQGAHPLGAGRFLRTLGQGGRVLSAYDASGSLGYILAGHSRVYVDGRTPLYFDDTDFGISREVFAHPDALWRAVERFGATAIVVERNRLVCTRPPMGWVPAVVEATFTTFVPANAAPAIRAIAPCGIPYLRKHACDHSADLDSDIARLEALGSSPFVRYLKAERILRCGGNLDELSRLIPSRREARSFLAARDGLEIAWLLRRGDARAAANLVSTAVRGGDPSAVGHIAQAITQDALPPSLARSVLEEGVARLADDTPPDLRAVLALACAADDDATCARFHGLRAAVRGSRQALPVLVWLRDHDPTPRGRADAAAWFDVLAAETKRGQAEPPPALSSSPTVSSPSPSAWSIPSAAVEPRESSPRAIDADTRQ